MWRALDFDISSGCSSLCFAPLCVIFWALLESVSSVAFGAFSSLAKQLWYSSELAWRILSKMIESFRKFCPKCFFGMIFLCRKILFINLFYENLFIKSICLQRML